jgi:hypothetical protein
MTAVGDEGKEGVTVTSLLGVPLFGQHLSMLVVFTNVVPGQYCGLFSTSAVSHHDGWKLSLDNFPSSDCNLHNLPSHTTKGCNTNHLSCNIHTR